MNATLDRSFVQLNRAATERIRRLVEALTDEQLLRSVGDNWTVAVALAHLAFWDGRVIHVVDRTLNDGKLYVPSIDILVNDISLPLWAAVPPREAARLAVHTADACDKRLESLPEPLLQQMYEHRQRDVLRALHRHEHLDDVDRALKSSASKG